MVELWCESGLSRAEFCRREELPYLAFLRWVKAASGYEEESPQFVEVVTSDEIAPRAALGMGGSEVIAPNGWRVRLEGRWQAGKLAALLEVVGRC